MLTQLLADAEKLSGDLPALQTAAQAIQADVGNPTSIDPNKLALDANALATAAGAVRDDVTALSADLGQLPQAKAAMAKFEAFLPALCEEATAGASITPNPQRACRLATLAVMGLEIASAFGLTIPPQVLALAQQLQAMACANPTPTPTPTP